MKIIIYEKIFCDKLFLDSNSYKILWSPIRFYEDFSKLRSFLDDNPMVGSINYFIIQNLYVIHFIITIFLVKQINKLKLVKQPKI